MDLTQIRYFLALAETLNFTRAADACNVTQPALTKSIQKLEDELGGSLLLRERGQSALTELGRTMLPLLQQTFDAASMARQGAAQFHRQDVAALRIGVGSLVPPEALLPLLRELTPRFPNLEESVRQGGTGALNDWLIGAEIDVAFTTDADGLTAKANHWVLFRDEVVAVLPSRHPWAQPEPLAAGQIVPEQFIGRAGPDNTPTAWPGVAGHPRHLGGTEEHVWTLIRSGLGIALSTARRILPPDIVSRRLEPAHALAVHVAAIPGRRPSRAADALVRLARAIDWDSAFAC